MSIESMMSSNHLILCCPILPLPSTRLGVGSHSLLQGIFPTQGSNPGLPHCRQILYQLSHKGSPQMWEMDHKEDWKIDAFNLWCCRRLLRVPWTVRTSTQSILREINPEYSLERLMLKLKAPPLWPPDAESWLTGKERHWCWKDWGQEEKWATEEEMVGWHHQLNGHEFEQTPEDSERQGNTACCSPWGLKE